MSRLTTDRTIFDDLPAVGGGVPIRTPDNPLIFGAPVIGDAEVEAVTNCLRSRWIGQGPRVEEFEGKFAQFKSAPYASAVSSGTAAIHLALLALGVGAGDEVIAPAMTFCSTIHAIVHTGATPVLADCLPDTFNIDPDEIETRINVRTKAILVVHMCGRCCEMDRILRIARRHNLPVIEDCAHAIEAYYHGQPAGTMGAVGCFSFYATKNITTGDGGMVVTSNRRLFRRMKTLALHGMTVDAWTRSTRGTSRYCFVEPGFKYNMTDIAASLGIAQLAAIEQRWNQREKTWNHYNEALSGLPLDLPAPVEPMSRHAYHLYTALLRDNTGIERDQLIAALRLENVSVGVHYVPVHLQPYYRKRFRLKASDYPAATAVGQRTLSLPLTAEMTDQDVADVARALTRVIAYYQANPARARSGNHSSRSSRSAGADWRIPVRSLQHKSRIGTESTNSVPVVRAT